MGIRMEVCRKEALSLDKTRSAPARGIAIRQQLVRGVIEIAAGRGGRSDQSTLLLVTPGKRPCLVEDCLGLIKGAEPLHRFPVELHGQVVAGDHHPGMGVLVPKVRKLPNGVAGKTECLFWRPVGDEAHGCIPPCLPGDIRVQAHQPCLPDRYAGTCQPLSKHRPKVGGAHPPGRIGVVDPDAHVQPIIYIRAV
ncbi:MAG: hypothetical protein A4E36_01498 [Methanoregulaceae archaeon PtaB.Bin009]|nr:MAG: hypothetical protein A4E36_01498 [Methanoregulaceae archaeon PtaB.Bin009]